MYTVPETFESNSTLFVRFLLVFIYSYTRIVMSFVCLQFNFEIQFAILVRHASEHTME